MKQISSKEFQIYKRYVFEQIANAFNKIGSLDIEYLDKVIGLEYEISDVTNLIYPKVKPHHPNFVWMALLPSGSAVSASS